MVARLFQKHFIRDAVEQVFAGMYFIANVHTTFVKVVKDRQPAAGQFFKSFLDQPGRPLRPWVKGMP